MTDHGARLALGTAQWGAGYGITNERGALSDSDVAAIAQVAITRGIAMADTHRTANAAHGYGNALMRLRPWAQEFQITTKVFGGPSADLPPIAQLEATLEDLGIAAVHACLVHDWHALTEVHKVDVARDLRRAREQGLVARIGISAYDTGELDSADQAFEVLGAVQVPVSPLDQRLVGSHLVERFSVGGVEVQARSIFLQGLLLDPDAAGRLGAHPAVRTFHARCLQAGLDPLAACLAFVRSQPWVDVVLVGVTSAQELEQIVDAWDAESVGVDWSDVSSADLDLLDPRRWSR